MDRDENHINVEFVENDAHHELNSTAKVRILNYFQLSSISFLSKIFLFTKKELDKFIYHGIKYVNNKVFLL